MSKGILVTAACIVALMAGIKDGRVLRKAGLTATCVVAQTAPDGSQVVACRAGALEGRPNLTRRSCAPSGRSGTYEYWRCPAAQAAGP